MKTKYPVMAFLVVLLLILQGCCTPSATIGSVNNTLRPQETNNWCWAAVTQMIAQNEGISISQCDLANNSFSKTNCCDFENQGQNCPKTEDCDTPWWPDLDFAGLKFTESENALTLAQLRKSIYCKKDVLGYGYGTQGIVGHVVAIKGYFSVDGTNYVVLNDPWEPCKGTERLITYEEYANPAGTATHWATWHGISKK